MSSKTSNYVNIISFKVSSEDLRKFEDYCFLTRKNKSTVLRGILEEFLRQFDQLKKASEIE